MYTYQMIGIADENGRTYKSKFGSYNRDNGFQLNEFALNKNITDLLYELFHQDCWVLNKPKKMTKQEIETVLGYEIDIVDNKKNETSNKDITNKVNTIFDDMFSFLKESYR